MSACWIAAGVLTIVAEISLFVAFDPDAFRGNFVDHVQLDTTQAERGLVS